MGYLYIPMYKAYRSEVASFGLFTCIARYSAHWFHTLHVNVAVNVTTFTK